MKIGNTCGLFITGNKQSSARTLNVCTAVCYVFSAACCKFCTCCEMWWWQCEMWWCCVL